MENFFNEADVISIYTRSQAIEDGFLIDVSKTAKQAGFKIPVAISIIVWESYIAWNDKDNNRQTIQNTEGRLWDVLYMCYVAIKKAATNSASLLYQLHVIPKNGKSTKPKLVTLKAVIGGGDNGDPVITIMIPEED